jgi:hypothetical protein
MDQDDAQLSPIRCTIDYGYEDGCTFLVRPFYDKFQPRLTFNFVVGVKSFGVMSHGIISKDQFKLRLEIVTGSQSGHSKTLSDLLDEPLTFNE